MEEKFELLNSYYIKIIRKPNEKPYLSIYDLVLKEHKNKVDRYVNYGSDEYVYETESSFSGNVENIFRGDNLLVHIRDLEYMLVGNLIWNFKAHQLITEFDNKIYCEMNFFVLDNYRKYGKITTIFH